MAAESFVKPLRALTWTDAASADWALVQQCAAGDEEACARLVTDHQRMVYQLALHLLGDPQEALDVSQEVFLRVFRTLAQFRGQSTLRTWIYRIVVNQASNRQRWWRRRRRAQQVALDEHTATHGELAYLEHTNLSAPFNRKLPDGSGVHRKLPFDQRAVIVLRQVMGSAMKKSPSRSVWQWTVKSSAPPASIRRC
jgi:RNA polymerase sigma-70 factor (ECF subfamily)